MAITREAAYQVAVATNLNFVLLEQIARMNRALVQNIDAIDLETTEGQELMRVLSRGLVIGKGVIDSTMNHYDTLMHEFEKENPDAIETMKPELEADPVLLDMGHQVHMTAQERMMELLKQIGKPVG